MSKTLAIAIVHGTGDKTPDFADELIEKLHRYFPGHVPQESRQDADIAIEPVYWADLTYEVEQRVWERVVQGGPLDHQGLRRFIFNVAGDTLAYQPSAGRRELYVGVHRVMAKAFSHLAERAGPEAPLCVIAHSMGSIVAHNFLYDMQNDCADDLPRCETPLERGDTLALLCTVGSPIAIWRLRFGDDYKEIDFPGAAVERLYPRIRARWLNLYDPDDVIAYPIATLTDHYAALAEAGYLEDIPKQVGSWFKRWNPLAHKGYLRDDDSIDDIARYLAELWASAYMKG